MGTSRLVCPQCKKKKHPSVSAAPFCSIKCKNLYEHNQIKCTYCEKEFTPETISQHFCSKSCKSKYWNGLNKCEIIKPSYEYLKEPPINAFSFNSTSDIIGIPGEQVKVPMKRKDVRRIGTVGGIIICNKVQCKVVSICSRPHQHFIEVIPFKYDEAAIAKRKDNIMYVNSYYPVCVVENNLLPEVTTVNIEK